MVRRRRRRTATAVAAALTAACGEGQKLGIADGPPGRRGQSAGQIDFVQRRCCLWWDSKNELRTVRYRGADGPPLKLEVCPEAMSLVGVRRIELRTVRHLGADSPQ